MKENSKKRTVGHPRHVLGHGWISEVIRGVPSHTKHNLATARTPRRRSDTVGHGSDTNSDSRRIAERHPRTRLGHASRNVDDESTVLRILLSLLSYLEVLEFGLSSARAQALATEALAQHYISRDTPPTFAGRFFFDWLIQPRADDMALDFPS